MLGNDVIIICLNLPIDDDNQLIYVSSTIDFFNYRPIVAIKRSYAAISYAAIWLDNWADATGILYSKNMGIFMSTPLSIVARDDLYDVVTPNMIMVINSRATNNNINMRIPRVSDMLYPDPSSLHDFLRGVLRYIQNIGPSAIAGAAAGGPMGALISALPALATEVVKDLKNFVAGKEKQQEKEVSMEEVNKTLGLGTATEKMSPEKQKEGLRAMQEHADKAAQERETVQAPGASDKTE